MAATSTSEEFRSDDLKRLTMLQIEAEIKNQGSHVGRDPIKQLLSILNRPSRKSAMTYPVSALVQSRTMKVNAAQRYSLDLFDDSATAQQFIQAFNVGSIPDPRLYLILLLFNLDLTTSTDSQVIWDDLFIPLYRSTDQELISMVEGKLTARSGIIRAITLQRQRETVGRFPYEHLKMPPPSIMFSKLQNYIPVASTAPYTLKGYYPKHEFKPQISTSDGNIYLSTLSPESLVSEMDGITDHFTEEVRMEAKRVDKLWSPMDFWIRNERWIKSKAGRGTVNDVIWANTQWATRFKPSWTKFLILSVLPTPGRRKMLDISAGWGDRLVTAISLDMDYLGFDPNTRLEEGHGRIIKMFGDPSRHRVVYEPFETDSTNLRPEYDIVLSSPPFFNLEEYTEDSKQSIMQYPGFDDWMTKFLLPSLRLASSALKPGGTMMIHISDTVYYKIVDTMFNFVTKDLNMRYLGVIGLAGEQRKYRPVWIWHKLLE